MTKNKKYKLALAAIKHYADLIDIWQKDSRCDSSLMVIKYGTDYSSSFCPYCREFATLVPCYGTWLLSWSKYKIARYIFEQYQFVRYLFNGYMFIKYVFRKDKQSDFKTWMQSMLLHHRYRIMCGKCPLNPNVSSDPRFCCNGLWWSMQQNIEKIPYAIDIIKYICDHAATPPCSFESLVRRVEGR